MENTDNEESLYSEGAVTGSAEDALQGRDVEIRTTGTEKVEVEEEKSTPDETPKEEPEQGKTEDGKSEEKEKSAEGSFEEEVTQAVKADKDLEDDLNAKGVDFDAMADEYNEKGELSAESYAKLEKAGYPRSVVDAYVKGLEATVEKFVNEVYTYAGGADEYNKLAAFIAQQNDGSAERFNALIEAGDVGNIKLAIDGYKSRMQSRNGYTGRSILGRSSSAANSGSNAMFSTREEMVKAMSDPRYGRDRAYTEAVQKKTMQCNFIG